MRKHVEKIIIIGLGLLLLITTAGCRVTSGETESYSVHAKPSPLTEPYSSGDPIQLVAGEMQKVEITIEYRRSERQAAKLKFNAQFSATSDLTVTPASWDLEQNLMNYAGHYFTIPITVAAAADASPGEREVKVIITPAAGRTSTSAVKFQVVKKSG